MPDADRQRENRHDHRVHSGAALIEAARAALSDAGERWTELRAAVFEQLARSDKPVSAYDIAEALGLERGKRVPAGSVYRILDLFVANNLALRVESANAFLANSHPGCAHDCIFMVCDGCGETDHVDDDRVAGSLRELAHARDFKATRPVIEIRGRCSSCREAA